MTVPRFVRAGHVDVNVGERRVVDGERALVVDAAVTRTEAAEAAADDQVVQDNSRIAAYKSDYSIGAADQRNRSTAVDGRVIRDNEGRGHRDWRLRRRRTES